MSDTDPQKFIERILAEDAEKERREYLKKIEQFNRKMEKALLGKHEPDELDIQCGAIFTTLRQFNLNADDSIALLEQCIDYLRMDDIACLHPDEGN